MTAIITESLGGNFGEEGDEESKEDKAEPLADSGLIVPFVALTTLSDSDD